MYHDIYQVSVEVYHDTYHVVDQEWYIALNMIQDVIMGSHSHNLELWSVQSIFGLASCNWMHNPKTDCTPNMVTVSASINVDEEVYDPPPPPHGCINSPMSYWNLRKMHFLGIHNSSS